MLENSLSFDHIISSFLSFQIVDSLELKYHLWKLLNSDKCNKERRFAVALKPKSICSYVMAEESRFESQTINQVKQQIFHSQLILVALFSFNRTHN